LYICNIKIKTKMILHTAYDNISLIDPSYIKTVFNCKSASELHANIIEASADWKRFRYEDVPGPNGTLMTVGADKFKGDLFEIFAEGFYKTVGNDPTIAIRDYTPVNQSEDYGVDATGLDNNGNVVTFSIKFRNRFPKRHKFDNTHILKDLGQFISWSQNGLGIPIQTKNRMIVFTTYDTMSPFSNPEITKLITVHGWKTIQYHADKNNAFWKNLQSLLES